MIHIIKTTDEASYCDDTYSRFIRVLKCRIENGHQVFVATGSIDDFKGDIFEVIVARYEDMPNICVKCILLSHVIVQLYLGDVLS